MKQFIYLFSVLFLISSCSTLNSIDNLVEHSNKQYKLKKIGNSNYVASVPMISKERKKKLINFYYTKEQELIPLIQERIRTYRTSFNENEIISFVISHYELKEYDTTGVINILFDEPTIKDSSTLEYIYYWDYSNFRFLVPLLPFFNEKHKRNQCVNRAIENCYGNYMDKVIISPTLNHFKLYRNQ